MPIPQPGVFTSWTTVANQWTLALQGGQRHWGSCHRNKDGNAVNVLLAVVEHGAPAPAATDWTDDVKYGPLAPGETYPLNDFGGSNCDIYVRAADNSAGITGVSWGTSL